MNSKTWIKVFLRSTLGIITLLIISFILVNPYQTFNFSITKKKFFYERNILPTKLFNLLKEDKYSIIFGTSRSQQLHYDETDIPILNFASLYGNSINVLEFLEQLSTNQIKNINRIYYLIDDHCLNGYDKNDQNSRYKHQIYNKPKLIDKIKHSIYLDFTKVERIFLDIKYNYLNNYSYYMNKYGSMIRINKNESSDVPRGSPYINTKQFYTEDGIKALLKINEFCKNNEIKIDYFTATHFDLKNKSLNANIMKEKWSKLLNGGLNGFYALWHIDNISNFIDNNKYIAFKDLSDHLNEYYNHKVFIDNVVKQSKIYYIHNADELMEYISKNKNNFK